MKSEALELTSMEFEAPSIIITYQYITISELTTIHTGTETTLIKNLNLFIIHDIM